MPLFTRPKPITKKTSDDPSMALFDGEINVVNDYRFRGLSQTNFKPAIQGGFKSDFFLGLHTENWNSSISKVSDNNPGVSAPTEMRVSGGYKNNYLDMDVGLLAYFYPVNGAANVNPRTTELFLAKKLDYGAVKAECKASYSLTNLFGIPNSHGSLYPEAWATYENEYARFTSHVGYQYVASNTNGISNQSVYSYADWSVGMKSDIGSGVTLALEYVGTNAPKVNGKYTYADPKGHNLGRACALISLTKKF